MGLQEHQSIVVVHDDTAYDHIHIVANRIHPETEKAWNGYSYKKHKPKGQRLKKEYQRHEEFTYMMEKKYGWTVEPGKYTGLSREEIGHSLSQGEYHSNKRAHEIATAIGYEDLDMKTTKERANKVNDELYNADSFEEFDEILAKQGLHLKAKGQGAVIRGGGGYAVKASDISRGFSGSKLEKRFGQNLKAYCGNRNRQIKVHSPNEIIDKFNNYFKQHIFDDLEEAVNTEKKHLASKLYIVRRYSNEFNVYKQQINDSFDRLYVDSHKARQVFSGRVESNGFDRATANLIGEPEQFGSIADRSELVEVSKQLSNISKLKGQYSNVLTKMDTGERKNYIQDLEYRHDVAGRLKQSLPGSMKAQALGVLRKELAKSESGQVINSSLSTSIQLSKMAKQVAENPKAAPMAAGLNALKQAQQLTKGEGGQAVEKILSRTASNVKLAASFARSPASGSIKIINKIVQSAIKQARETGRSMGRGL